MRNKVGDLVSNFVERRDLPAMLAEATKKPMDYILGNLKKPCRCAEVKEKDGSAGSLIDDFDALLEMHGGAIESAFVKWYHICKNEIAAEGWQSRRPGGAILSFLPRIFACLSARPIFLMKAGGELCVFLVFARYTLFFAGRLEGKKRSLLILGPSDTCKSFFGCLVRFQFPANRIFTPLASSEFCWDQLDSKMHLLGFCNDCRFSPKLPVAPCLNWLGGLTFKYNRKHQKPQEGKGPLCIFTSNDMKSSWERVDVEAFYARMATVIVCFVTLQMAGMPEKEANARAEICQKCGACALLKKSSALQHIAKNRDPLAFGFYELHLKQHYARKFPAPRPFGVQTQCDNAVDSEWEALVAEAENR